MYQLSSDGDKKAQEYRKTIDNINVKKDAELSTFLAEIHNLKEQLKMIDFVSEQLIINLFNDVRTL